MDGWLDEWLEWRKCDLIGPSFESRKRVTKKGTQSRRVNTYNVNCVYSWRSHSGHFGPESTCVAISGLWPGEWMLYSWIDPIRENGVDVVDRPMSVLACLPLTNQPTSLTLSTDISQFDVWYHWARSSIDWLWCKQAGKHGAQSMDTWSINIANHIQSSRVHSNKSFHLIIHECFININRLIARLWSKLSVEVNGWMRPAVIDSSIRDFDVCLCVWTIPSPSSWTLT